MSDDEVEVVVMHVPLVDGVDLVAMARLVQRKMGLPCIQALAERLPMGASDDEVRAFMHQEIERPHGADLALAMALGFSFILSLPDPAPPKPAGSA